MSKPDIQLNGVSIWVKERAEPDGSVLADANWLVVRATVRSAQALVTTEGTILMTTDFARFRNQLAAMYDTLSGEASLSGYEPNLKATLSAGKLGKIRTD